MSFKVGVQLYSIRDQVEQDMDKAFEKIREIGYEYVEFAGYYGKSANEILELLNKHNLKCTSVHQQYKAVLENPKETISYLNEIGVKYFVVPCVPKENFTDNEVFKQFVKDLKETSKILEQNNITLCYHNHEFEFEKIDGEFGLDRLFNSLTSEEIETQIDTCWVHYAGLDPAEYLRKYTNRATTVHLKDYYIKESSYVANYRPGYCNLPLGEGRLDFPKILKACEEIGTKYLIVEQEDHETNDPFGNLKKSRDYLKALGI